MTTASPPNSRASRLLRPVWLAIAFYVVCAIALGLFEIVSARIGGPAAANTREVLFQWEALASVVFATWIVLRKIEHLPWSAVALGVDALNPPVIIGGALLGGLTIGIASLLLLAGHMLRIERTIDGSWWGEAGHWVMALLPAAFFEELFVRGYLFSLLRRMGGWRLALMVTSLIFGLLHLGNPGADAESILAVTVAGFFLGAILLATRSLYAAGVAHFAWNWVMAGAFHIPVSGIQSPDVDYRTVETGPDWLTGGTWGPEGGVAAVALLFVAIFYLYGRYLRRMEWRA